jgi:hypothetical protein
MVFAWEALAGGYRVSDELFWEILAYVAFAVLFPEFGENDAVWGE